MQRLVNDGMDSGFLGYGLEFVQSRARETFFRRKFHFILPSDAGNCRISSTSLLARSHHSSTQKMIR